MLEGLASSLEVVTTILGTVMALSYFPQIYKIYRRKSVADISLIMYAVFFPGTLAWLLYGISLNSTPLMAANGVGLVGVGGVLVEYLRYR